VRTALWLAHYNALPGTRAVPLDASTATPVRALVEACHQLAPLRGGMAKRGWPGADLRHSQRG
jgi:ribosome biogenesis GTPase A